VERCHQSPTDAAPPAPRPLRPLAPSPIQFAEYATRHHVVTLSIGTSFEDCLDPA
jgi:hypothetical protein